MKLKENLIKLMESKNIKNIKELSNLSGIPYTTLRDIINDNGKANDIRMTTAIKLCDFFDITLDELFSSNLELSSIRLAAYQGLDTEGLDVSDIEEVNTFIKYVKSKKDTK